MGAIEYNYCYETLRSKKKFHMGIRCLLHSSSWW